MTPAASREIAIGMITIVLKNAAWLTRSVRTAKMSPTTVTTVGATTTQIALLARARCVSGVVKTLT